MDWLSAAETLGLGTYFAPRLAAAATLSPHSLQHALAPEALTAFPSFRWQMEPLS